MQILDLLQDLQKEFHLTYLIISHDLRVVAHVDEQIAVMHRGKIVEIVFKNEKNTLENAVQNPYTQALISAIPQFNRN